MKSPFLALLPLIIVLAACQGKPPGESVPLPQPPAPTAESESALKTSKTPAEIKREETSSSFAGEERDLLYQKPAKIKVKRDPRNNYTWEISGEDVKDILSIDRELRKKLAAGEEGIARGAGKGDE